MKFETRRIDMVGKDGAVFATVEADVAGGLGIHRCLSGRGWLITQVATGAALGWEDTKFDAYQKLEALVRIADWSQVKVGGRLLRNVASHGLTVEQKRKVRQLLAPKAMVRA